MTPPAPVAEAAAGTEPPVDLDATDLTPTPATFPKAPTPGRPMPPPHLLTAAATGAKLPAGAGATDAVPAPVTSPNTLTPGTPAPAPVSTTAIGAELRASRPTSDAMPTPVAYRHAPLSGDHAAAKPQVASPPTATGAETTPAPAEAPLRTGAAPTAAAITDPAAKADEHAAGDDVAGQDVPVPEAHSAVATTAPPLPAAMLVLPATAGGPAPSHAANSPEPPATATTAATVAVPLSEPHTARIEQEAAPDGASPSPAPHFAERLAGQAPAVSAVARQDSGDAAAAPGLISGVQPSAAAIAPSPSPAAPAAATHQPSVTAQPGRIGHEMGVEIARRVTAGGHELTVRMNPADMGRIEVRMAFDDGGTLRASVAAERPAALDLLRRDSADLHRALSDAGVRADAQSFRFDTRGGSGDQFGQRQGQHQHQQDGGRHNGAHRFYAGDPAADQPIFRALRTSGRVDLMA